MPEIYQKIVQSLRGFWAKIRGTIGLNIGTVMFGVLFLYMAFSAFLYMTSSHIESYQVVSGPLSKNETYTALALRSEVTCKAESNGYLTYFAREGSKINANGAVYGVSTTKIPEAETQLSTADLAQIRKEMMSFSKSFSPSKFNNTYSFKSVLQGNILQYAGINGNLVTLVSDGTDGDTTSSSVSSVTLGNQTISRAQTDGIVLYSKDGYENLTIDTIAKEAFNQNNYHETDLKTKDQVHVGDDIYTIINDERWSLLIPLSKRQAVKLSNRSTIRVKFLKDGMTQSGDFSIVEIEGEKYGKIDFSRGLIRYATERFLDIELVTNTVTGLKIPLTSIVTKEFYTVPSEFTVKDSETGEIGIVIAKRDESGEMVNTLVHPTIYASIPIDKSGNSGLSSDSSPDEDNPVLYYISKTEFQNGDAIIDQKNGRKFIISDIGVLEGVYCINQGYAVFRRIELLDQNEEYVIVSGRTSYGLSRYDHIVRNADQVKEEDILY